MIQPHTSALDVADAKGRIDERVEVDAARHHIAAAIAQLEGDAASGDALIAPSVTARLLSTFSELGASPREPAAQPVVPLTEREEEVLVTVALGRTNTEIADELSISLSTVKTHLASLMNKLGARNRVELAMWAYETDRMPA